MNARGGNCYKQLRLCEHSEAIPNMLVAYFLSGIASYLAKTRLVISSGAFGKNNIMKSVGQTKNRG
ncbi:MAG: hypothetical protein WC743_26665, partial [Mucilaginibacter sp.]